jgi:hypothetical protein
MRGEREGETERGRKEGIELGEEGGRRKGKPGEEGHTCGTVKVVVETMQWALAPRLSSSTS